MSKWLLKNIYKAVRFSSLHNNWFVWVSITMQGVGTCCFEHPHIVRNTVYIFKTFLTRYLKWRGFGLNVYLFGGTWNSTMEKTITVICELDHWFTSTLTVCLTTQYYFFPSNAFFLSNQQPILSILEQNRLSLKSVTWEK